MLSLSKLNLVCSPEIFAPIQKIVITCIMSVFFGECVYLWVEPVGGDGMDEWKMAEMRSCLFVVRGCGRLLVLGDTWSDVNVLLCVWEGVSWKRQRGRWADNPVCLMRLNAGIDWSPNHRRKWAWKWMGLCPWLAVELGGWVGGDVSCRKTWP